MSFCSSQPVVTYTIRQSLWTKGEQGYERGLWALLEILTLYVYNRKHFQTMLAKYA